MNSELENSEYKVGFQILQLKNHILILKMVSKL